MLYSTSALNLFIAMVAAKVFSVVFTWIWVALSKNYTRFLVYASMLLSLLSPGAFAVYMLYKGEASPLLKPLRIHLLLRS